ncbi:DUF2335 domain-containing protein [Solidesulfovibrio sp.]|uniref:DUF2335 domain-containing protein n=1 Tax=Solidesulfovibrio sp. TaxID=2910990 RepID=UPI00260A4456|nr:DUF2335 domain-containing protein [Solidesulfovibrio sp.]
MKSSAPEATDPLEGQEHGDDAHSLRLSSLAKDTEELLDKFPGKSKKQLIAAIASYSGPLAHPSFVKGYEEILPGAAERILTMAEAEGKHRREQESKVIHCEVRCKTTGLWLGFAIGMLAIAGSCAVAIFASPLAGTTLGIGSIASLAGVFVYGSKKSAK